MLPIGDLYVADRSWHADSLLLFAALAELIETGLQVRSLLSLTLQLLFKLANHCMGGVATRMRVASATTDGVSLAGGRAVGASSGWCLLGSGLALESCNALGLAASAGRNSLSNLLGS